MKILLASILVLLLSPTTLLAQLYSIEAYTCDSPSETRVSGGDPVHWGGTFNDCVDPESWVELDGGTSRGALRSMAHAVDGHEGGGPHPGSIAGVYAIMRFADVIFEGPAGTVSTFLNMDLHAFISASSVTGRSFGSIQVDIYLENEWSGGVGEIDAGDNPDGIKDVGMLEGLVQAVPGGAEIDATITTSVMEVPTNSPLFLLVSLHSHVAAYDPNTTADGFSNAGNTLNFPRNAPVFDLPAGYTVSSAQAGIVDNSWTSEVRNGEISWGVLKSRY